jgi:TPP-dependent pyruvate/acetoin dehydrogenase alpha subunit
MHLYSKEYGLLGTNGIVGYGLHLGAGAAFTARYQDTSQVAVAFFGDGAANLGSFHEIVNLAAVWKLPVVFVCENNLYATELSFLKATAGQNVAARAAGYGIPGLQVDGQDVLTVYDAAGEAVERARSGDGPSLLECLTYRYVGHHEGDPGTEYRTQEEIDEWKKRDPILLFQDYLLGEKAATPGELDQIDKEARALIREALEYANSSPWPSPDELATKVFASATSNAVDLDRTRR